MTPDGDVTKLNEDTRTYIFSDSEVRIVDVRELVVRPSGTHRVRNAAGELYVIPVGWRAIRIEDVSENWTV